MMIQTVLAIVCIALIVLVVMPRFRGKNEEDSSEEEE